MIVRGLPKNKDDYIKVNSCDGKKIHKEGFIPKYIDKEYLYFLKTNELIEYLRKEEEFIE